MVLECTLNLLFASAFVALFPRKVVGDIRGCSRYIYSRCERVIKLVGEARISLDFVSELSRTKSITFPS